MIRRSLLLLMVSRESDISTPYVHSCYSAATGGLTRNDASCSVQTQV
jgi:hypothetical protein